MSAEPIRIRLGLSVVTDDPALVARVSEQLARTAAGLALEGVDALVMIGPDDESFDE